MLVHTLTIVASSVAAVLGAALPLDAPQTDEISAKQFIDNPRFGGRDSVRITGDAPDSVRITGDAPDSVRITRDDPDSVRITGDDPDSVRITGGTDWKRIKGRGDDDAEDGSEWTRA
ncbi:hypothetical protein MFIFM68171_05808 [Madurella fahalii]|uniref:Uncharacterized protein n=1 Tax=Madurella fahalii TaxID=1157608 RepID=A0ABQ0GCW0_9PEZI